MLLLMSDGIMMRKLMSYKGVISARSVILKESSHV